MCYCPRPCQSSLCQKSVAYQVINPALHFMTIQHVQAATCLQGARLNAFFQPNGSNPAYIICCFNVAERFKTIVQELIKCLSFFNLSFTMFGINKIMKNRVLVAFSLLALSGCSTMSSNEAIPPLQAETAKMLGLSSSDEITVTNVSATKPDTLGSQMLSYRATTDKGRIFDCQSQMIPGILGQEPVVTVPKCTPVKVHN